MSSSSATSDETTTAPTCTAAPCHCPDDSVGVQHCLTNGALGPCECPPPAPHSDSSTSTTSADGSTTEAAESSTGPTAPVECPDFSVPCAGTLALKNDGDFTDASMCTSLEGELLISGTVTSLAPLGCLTELDELNIEATALTDLSGLTRLERLGTLRIEGAPELTHLGMPALEHLVRIAIVGNTSLTELDVPALIEIAWDVEITDNPALSNCEVEALLDQVGGTDGSVCYQANARDLCPPSCP